MSVVGKYFIEINAEHLDVFGHVNALHYYKFLDEAKWDYSEKNGFGLDVVKALQQGPVLLEQNVKFYSEINLNDNIEVKTFATENAKRTTRGMQLMTKSSGDRVCKAEFILGYFDMTKRRLVNLSPQWKQATPINEAFNLNE